MKYIFKLKYNLLILVTSRVGYKYTEETKKKISNTQKIRYSKSYIIQVKFQISIPNYKD